MNEQEGLPLWKKFEEATGIKTEYVRANDNALMARTAIERRRSSAPGMWSSAPWSAACRRISCCRSSRRRPSRSSRRRSIPTSVGMASTPITIRPAYNTKMVKGAELPKSYEEFATKKEWEGKVAIDVTDAHWLNAMYIHYGEEKARRSSATSSPRSIR